MIEVVFAIILGFAIASTLCGLMEDGSKGDRVLIRLLIYFAVLFTVIGIFTGRSGSFLANLNYLALGSVFNHLIWFLGGAVMALCYQVVVEGHLHELWIKFHPQSAPTPEAKMGKRSKMTGLRRERTPATLVGTSTSYLNSELDLRTETLIRLSFSVFEDRSALMISRLESALCLGTGRRQKSFHKIIAGHRGRPKSKRIVHRYWRSVNGSSRLSQSLFGELCKLARDTHNRDRATVDRLTEVGTALGLTADEMGRAIRGSL